ncbi:MAG TPA: hypothetical protein PKE17_19925 [Saprospiraceae bacterium]|nr:hypothetical protein [Saprospiraceae bacterium]
MSTDKHHFQQRHFRDPDPGESLNLHIIEQINYDLDWGLSAAHTFRTSDGKIPIDALLQGLNAIAGRRYSRYKEAESNNQASRSKEMQELAKFWYKLEREITELFDMQKKHPPQSSDTKL